MKRKIFMALAIIALAVGMQSCAVKNSNLLSINDNAVLNTANFEYVGSAQAEADVTYVFGFGGGGNPEQEAINKLRENAKLKANQALINISVTKSTKRVWFVSTKTVIATADIIQFR